jgi:hypothetical protein
MDGGDTGGPVEAGTTVTGTTDAVSVAALVATEVGGVRSGVVAQPAKSTIASKVPMPVATRNVTRLCGDSALD